jgi:hypothetical protein
MLLIVWRKSCQKFSIYLLTDRLGFRENRFPLRRQRNKTPAFICRIGFTDQQPARFKARQHFRQCRFAADGDIREQHLLNAGIFSDRAQHRILRFGQFRDALLLSRGVLLENLAH